MCHIRVMNASGTSPINYHRSWKMIHRKSLSVSQYGNACVPIKPSWTNCLHIDADQLLVSTQYYCRYKSQINVSGHMMIWILVLALVCGTIDQSSFATLHIQTHTHTYLKKMSCKETSLFKLLLNKQELCTNLLNTLIPVDISVSIAAILHIQ
jgi:hypothetical protein